MFLFQYPLLLSNQNRVYSFLVYGYCISFALSIAISKIFLGSAIAFWLWRKFEDRKETTFNPLATILGIWFLICLTSSLTGLNPLHSLKETIKTGFFLLTPFAVAPFFLGNTEEYHNNRGSEEILKKIFFALGLFFTGQSIAAVHTLLKEGVAPAIPQIIPGALTESGQIVILVPLLISFLISRDLHAKFSLFYLRGKKIALEPVFYFAAIIGLNLVSIWPGIVCRGVFAPYRNVMPLTALGLALVLIALPLLRARLSGIIQPFTIWASTALIISALIINLKRGPWFGVLVEILIIGFLFSRRLAKWTVALVLLSIAFLDPVRSRVDSFVDHFTISGGRQEMWSIGSEIVQRYPLGVGFQNAKVIRDIDPSLPPTHRHLHNNLLNIAVETGWIGVTVFCLWIFQLLKMGITSYRRMNEDVYNYSNKRVGKLGLFLAISFIGWQVAGLVEYNFGDGEIRMLALFMMGVLLAIEQETVRVQKLAKVIRFQGRRAVA